MMLLPLPKLSDRHLAELGLLFALVSIAGVGVPMIWPDQKGVGAAFVIFGLAGAILICCTWVWRFFRRNFPKRQKMVSPIGMIICGIGLLGVTLAHFWPSKPGQASPSPLDNLVQLSCQWSQLPAVAPDYPVAEFELNNNFILEGGVFIGFSQQPNQKLSMITTDAPDYAWRCQFSNFGKIASLNTMAEFTVNFKEVAKTQNSTTSGKIIKTSKLMTLPFTLCPG